MENEAQTVEDKDDEISLIDLLATLLRHKKLIIFGTVGVAVIVLIYSVISLTLPPDKSYLPNLYTPKAVVLVSDESGGGLSSMLAASGLGGIASLAGVSVGGGSKAELAIMLAKSKTAIDELNAEFDFTGRYKIKKNVKSDTRKVFLEHFSASLDEKAGTVSLSFEDVDPEYAASVVNRSVEILDRRFAALNGNRAGEQKRLLEGKLADVQAEINRIQAKISAFTSKYGVLSVEALATEQVTVLARLRSELIMKDMEIENYEQFTKVEDPVIRRLKNERNSIQAKIAELESGRSSVMPGQKDITSITFEFAALQRDLMVQGEILKLLTQQYELARLEEEGQGPSFQVIELAEAPDKKSGPSRGMICVVATMAAFFLSVLGAFVIEAVKSIKKDPEAMAKLRGEARP